MSGKNGDPTNYTLSLLRALYPPQRVLVVGPITQFQREFGVGLGQEEVVVVDPDQDRVHEHVQNSDLTDKTRIINAILSPHGGRHDYYMSSLPSESGLVSPEFFAELWQNISITKKFSVETQTPRILLERLGGEFDWLILCSLNVSDVVRGLGDFSDVFDVVIVRTVRKNTDIPLYQHLSSTHMTAHMEAAGYRLYASLPTGQPKICMSVYVRDWKNIAHGERKSHQQKVKTLQSDLELARTEHMSLVAARDEQIADLQRTLEVCDQSLAAEQSAHSELLGRYDEEVVAKTALSAQLQELQQKVKTLQSDLELARTEHMSLVAARDEQIADLQRRLAQEIRRLAEMDDANQALCEELNSEMDKLQQRLNDETAVKVELDKALTKLKSESKQAELAFDQERQERSQAWAAQAAAHEALKTELRASSDACCDLEEKLLSATNLQEVTEAKAKNLEQERVKLLEEIKAKSNDIISQDEKLGAAIEEGKRSLQLARLAENNLLTAQNKYRELAVKLQDQSDRMGEIEAHLLMVSEHLTEDGTVVETKPRRQSRQKAKEVSNDA